MDSCQTMVMIFFPDTKEQRFLTTESYSPFCDCDDVYCDHPLDDMETMLQFQEDNDPRQSQLITPRSHSRSRPLVSTVVDPLQSEVPIMPSDVVQVVFILGNYSG